MTDVYFVEYWENKISHRDICRLRSTFPVCIDLDNFTLVLNKLKYCLEKTKNVNSELLGLNKKSESFEVHF